MHPHATTERVCAHCGNSFTVERLSDPKRYCSRLCANRATVDRRVASRFANWTPAPQNRFGPLVCGQCGQPFYVRRRDTLRVQRFCSLACADYARDGKPLGTRAQRLTVRCRNCAIAFDCYPSRRDKAFCSMTCQRNWEQSRRIEKRCAGCGQPFRVIPSRLHRLYCSNACYVETALRNPESAGNPRGPNWKRQARAARKRDGYTCQRCGITQAEAGSVLPVHHIMPFCEFGLARYEEANQLTNLITLCRSCHRYVEWETGSMRRHLANRTAGQTQTPRAGHC